MDQEKNSDNNKFKEYITEGIEGNIVLIGFPHDLGARAAGKSFGQEYGPGILSF